MENASKALIIAGAVLISILLITIGIVVINMVNGNINQAEDELLTQEAIQFNSKFTAFAGEQTAGGVRQVLNMVISNRGSSYSKHGIRAIIFNDNPPLAPDHPTASKYISKLDNSKKYIVTFEDRNVVFRGGAYYKDSEPDGYLDTITIKEKN